MAKKKDKNIIEKMKANDANVVIKMRANNEVIHDKVLDYKHNVIGGYWESMLEIHKGLSKSPDLRKTK